MYVKFFIPSVHFGQPEIKDSVFQTVHVLTNANVQLKPSFVTIHRIKMEQILKRGDNSNNVHVSGVTSINSPYLVIKSALSSLGSIITRCRPQMNLTPSK